MPGSELEFLTRRVEEAVSFLRFHRSMGFSNVRMRQSPLEGCWAPTQGFCCRGLGWNLRHCILTSAAASPDHTLRITRWTPPYARRPNGGQTTRPAKGLAWRSSPPQRWWSAVKRRPTEHQLDSDRKHHYSVCLCALCTTPEMFSATLPKAVTNTNRNTETARPVLEYKVVCHPNDLT